MSRGRGGGEDGGGSGVGTEHLRRRKKGFRDRREGGPVKEGWERRGGNEFVVKNKKTT